MALLVLKFGGTSVADLDRIRNVATKVKREVDAGHQVAVVVSAMAGVTNQLVEYASSMAPLSTPEQVAEYDTVVSSGEQVTSGLLALALQTIGVQARSMLGWQLPIRTDEVHSKARIEAIDTAILHQWLNNGFVVVVPGFQGISRDERVTTLGRGGSDTSAVALAAALQAERCDIYTDVDGVYTSDPRLVPKARKLQKVGYEEMLEMASLGAKVLQTRSVEMAMKHGVRVQVRSSFDDADGTLLVDEEEIMERRLITGIAYSRNEAQVTLTGVKNIPGVAAEIFGPLADAEINVDMIVQNVTENSDATDITFTVTKEDLQNALRALESKRDVLQYRSIFTDENVAKVSVIGVGMRSHAGLAQKMFRTLADKGVNIQVISTSEIKVSVLIPADYLELALRALHTAYGLDAKEEA
ncbi:MAG: aspartate kinase [Hyphomicrobiales bacterium]|nr:aspartate kinase [Hyphomicrobiales bacterium]